MQTDAFGNSLSRTGTNPTPFLFAGQWQYQADSQSGLMLLGNRYYDAEAGRFISKDPIKAGDNWYAYCNNNPLKSIDPKGLDADKANKTLQVILWGLNGLTGQLENPTSQPDTTPPNQPTEKGDGRKPPKQGPPPKGTRPPDLILVPPSGSLYPGMDEALKGLFPPDYRLPGPPRVLPMPPVCIMPGNSTFGPPWALPVFGGLLITSPVWGPTIPVWGPTVGAAAGKLLPQAGKLVPQTAH